MQPISVEQLIRRVAELGLVVAMVWMLWYTALGH